MQVKFSERENARPLFRFVVVADTHVNESESVSTSPFETNRYANARARRVFQEIAIMQPPPLFCVHLGDIVHPVPPLPTYQAAACEFQTMTRDLPVPLHLVPGNHDVGDKRVDSVPADSVCDDFLKVYREIFGRDYYAFDRQGCRFVVLNSLLLNSGLSDETQQRKWFEQQLADPSIRRCFVFMHYPPYVFRADERSNYDGIDEPARSWLLKQLSGEKVEAVFAGHVHNFWYDRIADTELYMLPSTAFVRHDYSEFYRVAPAIEHGRGDLERFGYFVVEVFDQNHVAYSMRTMGAMSAPGETVPDGIERFLAHPKSAGFDRVGVELRHPWTESMQIASTGGIQEFGRKWARNDYPLLALWEMGVRLSKVPEIDLREESSRERMCLLARMGHRFLVTTVGLPNHELLEFDLLEAGVIGFEINSTIERFESRFEQLLAFRNAYSGCLYLSRIHTDQDANFDGKHFTHQIRAGFVPDELRSLNESVGRALDDSVIDGLTVRIESDSSVLHSTAPVADFVARRDVKILVSIKLAGSNIAKERVEPEKLVASTVQAMILSQSDDRVSYVFDTFMDVDRGYFPRQAFIDRRFNPRPGAKAFAVINATLSRLGDLTIEDTEVGEVEALTFEGLGERWQVMSGSAKDLRVRLPSANHAMRVSDGVSIPITDLGADDERRQTLLISLG